MLADDADQPAADQQRQRVLHGAAREAGGDGDAAVAGAGRATLGAAGLPAQLEV